MNTRQATLWGKTEVKDDLVVCVLIRNLHKAQSILSMLSFATLVLV